MPTVLASWLIAPQSRAMNAELYSQISSPSSSVSREEPTMSLKSGMKPPGSPSARRTLFLTIRFVSWSPEGVYSALAR